MEKTYAQRIELHTNPTARKLLELMERKKTNLSISADVTTKRELLQIAELTGPYICVLKTHIDIIDDFDSDLIEKLTALSIKHDFLLFEDRKFADIGNTVKHQYAQGVYKIASWSHITNAHIVPGPGIIHGLSSVGLPLNRGLLLLAQMSSSGNLATANYTNQAVAMADANPDFVIGFIAMQRLSGVRDYLVLTPGVALGVAGDAMGQQYRTPSQVIRDSGCDVIIVGRGIYEGDGGNDGVVKRAEMYRREGWNAYLERIASKA